MYNEVLNKSGCKGKTAYEAIKNIRREERRKVIEEMKAVAEKHGYLITSKVSIKEILEVKNEQGQRI